MWGGTGSSMGSPENSKQTDQSSPQIQRKIDITGANNSTIPHPIKSLRKSVSSKRYAHNI
jgi:hypothetical protein